MKKTQVHSVHEKGGREFLPRADGLRRTKGEHRMSDIQHRTKKNQSRTRTKQSEEEENQKEEEEDWDDSSGDKVKGT
jgi:hypothetical protein